ncbi:NUDIX domain-containing protein [Patescibacteria group bacterium]|nr:NUDIX domain-containing protein [Patescibacteria group bacterium]MBU1028659.1 NUDIX domain-containing protein [Patescibacteria group bacterium]MBU1916362.1 NUDIX domain-containing protein [Patescibacteria group bacterium]
MSENCPRVGIGCLVLKDGRILLGKRLGSFEAGTYDSAGGHLEYMESIEAGLRREVREEAGIEISEPRLLCVINYRVNAPKHYIGIGFVADWLSGEPTVCEPDKRESWDWYDLDNLPEPLFGAAKLYIEALKTGRTFFDE